MAFNEKKKLRATVLKQEARIRELEEILCPCEAHEWVQVGFHLEGGTGRGDELTIYHKICKRCKKRIQSIHP